jgi:D-alanyl-D-alanine dipeptidase
VTTGPEVTLIADPRVLAIPIRDCGEPLGDLRDVAGVAFDARKRDHAELWLHARSGVAERLLQAQARCPPGIRLLLIEAYRPLELQRRYFAEYCARLRQEHREWDEQTVYANASRYVAPPDIEPPHSTGGAIDLALVDADGRELDLGTAVNASPESSDGACYTAATNISESARRNRELLKQAMTAAGFANYPTEWWHWSYGDRYWAYCTQQPVAFYGSVPASDFAVQRASRGRFKGCAS